MKTDFALSGNSAAVIALTGVLAGFPAFAAPGEDPISLKGPVTYQTLPTGQRVQSGGMDGRTDIPTWMRARMSRYVAKAFSATAEDGSLYTDSDVVTTKLTDGFKKSCIQEVGSNTTPPGASLGTKYGPQTGDQVVVLRGDLVNVCR